MTINAILGIIAALLCGGLVICVLFREKQSFVRWSLLAGLVALAAESVFATLSCEALDANAMQQWQVRRFFAMSAASGFWLIFSLVYARGNYREFIKNWRLPLAAAFVVPVALEVLCHDSLFEEVYLTQESAAWIIRTTPLTNMLHIMLILVAVTTIMNLEKTFRAATGTMRWRIKFMVLGLAFYLAVRIYSATQILLYSSLDLTLEGLNAGALIVCTVLMLRSILRTELLRVDLYPSQHLLYHSFTAVLTGLYLLAMGLMAHLATRLGDAGGFPLGSFVLFLALIGFAVVAVSDRARQTIKRYVARQFGRPMYDSRKVWTQFTHKTATVTDTRTLGHAVIQLVSDTFESLSVTIWLVDETSQKLIFGDSTALANTRLTPRASDSRDDADLIDALGGLDGPVDIDAHPSEWGAEMQRRNPTHFPGQGGHRICVPLLSAGEVLGAVVLADRVRGVPYSLEEYDLLQTIGEQVAAKLLNVRLATRLLEAKQMEAFQAMSTFFVHDLKNTSSTLSLMLQNMPKHFADPAFREDALAAIAKSVNKINDLIQRLTTLREKLEAHPVPSHVPTLLNEVVKQIGETDHPRITFNTGQVTEALLDPELIQKVLTNLILNARQATGRDGLIEIETSQRKGWIVLTVRDDGCGMAQEFMRKSLFHPFKSTKTNGLGIGLFHSKMIVEAHRGKLEVESEEGKGSTFRVLLPHAGATT